VYAGYIVCVGVQTTENPYALLLGDFRGQKFVPMICRSQHPLLIESQWLNFVMAELQNGQEWKLRTDVTMPEQLLNSASLFFLHIHIAIRSSLG